LHFVVGNSQEIDSLKVIWASGKGQVLRNFKVNQAIIVSEKMAIYSSSFLSVSSQTTFAPPLFISSQRISFRHKETPFFDYYVRRLQPQKYS